jgi:hypothetical protein
VKGKKNSMPVMKERPQFENFTKLPVEIQHMVFSEATINAEARVIEVSDKRSRGNKFISKSEIPALMKSGLGSRLVVRKFYSELPTAGVVGFSKDTFVNWDNDIFFKSLHDLRVLVGLGYHLFKEHCRNLAIMLAEDQNFTSVVGWAGLENVEQILFIQHITKRYQAGILRLKDMDEVSRSGFSHTKATERATAFLARSRHSTRDLKKCVAMDAQTALWAPMGRVLWGKTHPRKPMGGPGLRAIWAPICGPSHRSSRTHKRVPHDSKNAQTN